MTWNPDTDTVIYRSRMHAKTKRNFEVFTSGDFIAAITQHIPNKGFQMVRYYGWYSNRARGERAKHRPVQGPKGEEQIEVIDVSEYEPRRLPSVKWRELINLPAMLRIALQAGKVWEVDPYTCPRCGSEMRMIALIDDTEVIRKIPPSPLSAATADKPLPPGSLAWAGPPRAHYPRAAHRRTLLRAGV